MRKFLVSVSALALAACGAPAASGPAPADAAPEAAAAVTTNDPEIKLPQAGTYEMDPTHTSVTWTVKHLGLSNYTARFDNVDIKLTLDPENIAASTLRATIDPKSVDVNYPADYVSSHPDTGFSSWQQDLAEAERWFNANMFPQITFVATKIEQTGPDTAKITGDLTLKGVTKPVTLDAKYNGVVNFPNAPETDRIGFSASTIIKRSDFGFTTMDAFIGDEVAIYIESEFTEVTG